MTSETLTVVDLFCGAGGFSEGFRQAGYRVIAGVDSDPDACATFARNFPEAACLHGDLREGATREAVLAVAEGVDVVIGGPPCQAFSQMRNHRRLIDDPRNALYREFVGVVARTDPAAFVMENVPGLAQMGVLDQVTEDLALGGRYRVRAQVLDAADFGVPQTRKRLVFTGLRALFGCDPPVMHGSGATDALALERRRADGRVCYEAVHRDGAAAVAGVTVAQAIGDLARLEPGERRDELDASALPVPSCDYQRRMRAGLGAVLANTSVPRINADTRLRLAALPPGGNYRDLPPEMTRRYLTGGRWGPSNGTGRLGRRHYYAYRRLHPDLWSWTLNTKADAVYHYEACRALSVREFARLQSFPDTFVFTIDPRRGDLPGRVAGGAAHSRYRQAGNAVAPLLARAVAEALTACLRGPRPPGRGRTP